ncbi:hypothetical protein B9Z19DRAFT_1136842 [Tuber borchii]|uniref:Protein kinase domain-containing protein n=1 Tax=Tuber borchii TaxID=42251 RepID=A0A2T6ZB57_TUBBO|nr:hypothetical protein B9Z19DRAFT_1136842 [Tuber borchii]
MEPVNFQAQLLSNDFDPSKYRLLNEFLPSGEAQKSSSLVSSPHSDYPENLQDFVRLMESINAEGPYFQRQVHLGSKYLGSGAQFDVFGHQHLVRKGFPHFDLPYISKILDSELAPVVVAVNLLLILEHGNCSLRHFLFNHKRNIPNPPEQVLQKLGLDVSQGLSALHNAGIIHGDIKTDNVLVFPAEAPFFCIAKLSDFGFSILDMEKTRKIYSIGTPGWQAPELGDIGVSTNMLTKCDYFLLGLLILRTAVRAYDGYEKTSLEEVSGILKHANISQPMQNYIRDVTQYLLPSRPQERASDLGKVCDRLSQVDQVEFDRTGNWVQGRFDDDTPWKEYEMAPGASSMLLRTAQHYRSIAKENGIQPQNKSKRANYSWLPIYKFLEEVDADTYANIASHYVDGIDEVSQKPQVNITGDLVGQEISGYQLLGMCFSGQLHGSRSDIRARTLEDNDTKWQRNTVASGFLLGWKFAHENLEEHVLALSDFRQSGGYNAHYAYNMIEKESAYSPSGLLHEVQGPLEWLKNYPLHQAAALGQTTEVVRLVDDGYNINSLDINGETPLQRASMAGHASTTRCLVQRGADATLKSKLLGTIPLHWLFVFELSQVNNIADILVGREKENLGEESNVEADAFHFPFKWLSGSPIAWSVLSNRYEAISALLRLRSSLDSILDFFPSLPEWPENTDPYYDVHSNSIQKRNLFKAWIYNPILQYQHPICQNSAKYVAERGALEGLKELSSNKLDLRIVNRHGGELQTAVVKGDLDAVQRLIDSGADVNTSPSRKDTLLLAAIYAKNPDIVKLLLDNGAKVNFSPDALIEGPLQQAANIGNMQITMILLNAGADVNSQSQKPGHTGAALYEASGWGGIDMIEMLLAKGANYDIIGGINGTPLQRAACAERASLEKVKLLLEHGADPNVRVGYYETALQAAASTGKARVVKALLEAGADPNIEGGHFWTALQAAVIPSIRSHEILDILLERKVDVNTVGGSMGPPFKQWPHQGMRAWSRSYYEREHYRM